VNLAAFRRHCSGLPGATHDVKWGSDEVYSVGGRMFAVFAVHQGRATALSFKCEPARFLELTDLPGIVPAPYLARAHWVQLGPGAALGAVQVRALIERSHALVFARLTRRQQAELAAATPTNHKAAK
jgi:predicted DNA-binding protein (MmcQ/YjbR family)